MTDYVKKARDLLIAALYLNTWAPGTPVIGSNFPDGGKIAADMRERLQRQYQAAAQKIACALICEYLQRAEGSLTLSIKIGMDTLGNEADRFGQFIKIPAVQSEVKSILEAHHWFVDFDRTGWIATVTAGGLPPIAFEHSAQEIE